MLLLVFDHAKRIAVEPKVEIGLPLLFALLCAFEERVVEKLRNIWPIIGVLLHAELDKLPVII